MDKDFRIVVFASGKGSNAAEIFRHFNHHPTIQVALLLCNNPKAPVLELAKASGIPFKVFSRQEFSDGEVLSWLKEFKATHLVLAGFLWLIPAEIIRSYPGRIVNIHPALLPQFGGKGMYGINVHEHVKASGAKETGITIHLVDGRYDEGKILFQASCPVEPKDSVGDIAAKVRQLEHVHYPMIIEQWITGGVQNRD